MTETMKNSNKKNKDRRMLEGMLIVVTLGMGYLFYEMGAYKMVVLNLFYLPILLSGYFLGRGNAGVLALFCAVTVTIGATLDSSGFAAYESPVMIGLALTVWAAVLGLSALLVGTLCDERAAKVDELHDAYVGVVNVLTTYLQSANPKIKARSTRIAELSQSVAERMRLSRKQIDDIRVAALLHDMANVEITTKTLSRAVDTLEANHADPSKHTFLGADLVHSLGSVLHGAVPLLVSQDDELREVLSTEEGASARTMPLGARIIYGVRAFDRLTVNDAGTPAATPQEALHEMRRDATGRYDPEVVTVIQKVVGAGAHQPAPELAAT